MVIDRMKMLALWQGAALSPSTAAEIEHQAVLAMAYKANFYDPVAAVTGIPWYVVAAFDMREESFNHNGYLGNGDPLYKKTVHVPAGRGPFKTWYEGAIDALDYDKVQILASGGHWDIVTALIKCEDYNGIGYEYRSENSPYVWAGTNRQQRGKFGSDGKYDPSQWDSQPGCAGLFLALKLNHGVDLQEA